jgi:SAM-dependent methyltransferase
MMLDRPCPLCGDNSSSVLFAEARINQEQLGQFAFASRKLPEYMHHRLQLCRTCDVVFASPVPDVSELHAAYETAAFDSQPEAAQAAQTYRQALQPVLERLPDRNGALDIGTGDGAFLWELQQAGFHDLQGIEPSAAPLAVARPEIRGCITQGLFEPGRFAANRFSLVTCFQTIEHVDDPLGLCREAFQLLKPGGALCLVGHNRRALSAKLLGHWSPIYDIEHLQLFSPRGMDRLLTLAGFDSITVRSLWNRYPLTYWTRLFPMPRGLKRLLIGALNATSLGSIKVALPAGNLLAFGFKR